MKIVVGYDGSEAAERALLRAADVAGEGKAVVIVTVTPQIRSAGPGAEPLLEPSADTSDLLAAARATVTAHASPRRPTSASSYARAIPPRSCSKSPARRTRTSWSSVGVARTS